MTVLHELTGLEDKVRARMRELRPLLDEYAELEKIAQRLGISIDEPPRRSSARGQHLGARTATPASSTQTATSKPLTSKTTRDPRQAARSRTRRRGSSADKTTTAKTPSVATANRQPGAPSAGRRADQVLALIKRHPGVTVRDLGSELGVAPTSLYRIIKRLESQGAITKRGRELQPS